MASVRPYPRQDDQQPQQARNVGQLARTFGAFLENILGHARLLQQRNANPRLRDGLAAIERTAQEGTAMARLILNAPPARSQEPAGVDLPARRALPARILVVGDPDALGRELVETLVQQGHAVEVLNHPLQALASLGADAADLLFTDLGTPDLTGWELASRAQVVRPGLPVVIVTRYAHQLDQQRLHAMGVTRVLPKPYLREEIAQVVAANSLPLSVAA